MIKYLVMDVDGTLTDGKIYMGAQGEMMKSFNIKDGYGIHDILPKYGIIPIVITARSSKIVENRCEELGIKDLYQGERDKLSCLCTVMEMYGQKKNDGFLFKDVAYIGDDILDMECMTHVLEDGGMVGCPADAVDDVKGISSFVASKCAGDGAVREFIEWLIRQ